MCARRIHNGIWIYEVWRTFQAAGKVPFPQALLTVSHFKSTDPRDKIYGLLGFVDVPLGTNTEFQPNYDETNTAEAVYTNTARYLLEWDPQMSILQFSGIGFPRPQFLEHLPSWVPDWSSVDKEVKCFGTERRCAGGPLINKPRVLGQDSKRLTIDGMIVDTISRLSSIRPKAVHDVKPKEFFQDWLWRFRVQKYKEESVAWFDEVEEMVASLSNPTASDSWKTSEKKAYPFGETKNLVTLSRAFALTMVAGTRPVNGDPGDAMYMKLWEKVVSLHRGEIPSIAMEPKVINCFL
jgi:hypothetical protein